MATHPQSARDRQSSPHRPPLIIGLLLGLIAMVSVWCFVGYFVPRLLYPDVAVESDGNTLPPPVHEVRGTLGDQFGAVNALFSGLALVGVVIALWLQQHELRQAIREHREASEQHTKMIKTQVLISLMEEIRSSEWGAAHQELADWQRRHADYFEEQFRIHRTNKGSEAHAIDPHRRVFIGPLHRLHRLWSAGIIDDDLVRVILTPDIALTLLNIVEPLERAIRPNYMRGVFDMVRALFPDEDELRVQGLYPNQPDQTGAPPSGR